MEWNNLTPEQKQALRELWQDNERQERQIIALYVWLACVATVSFLGLISLSKLIPQ